MSEWKEYKIGECLERVIDNRGKTPPFAETITPYGLIEVNALTGNRKFPNYNAVRKFVSKEAYETWFRCGHPERGDVVFATVGTIAEVAILNQNKGSIAQNLIALRPNRKVLQSDFLYYHFITPSVKQSLMALDISSVQPSIKVPHLLETTILLPSLFEQQSITGMLSSLDDKIDLLHRQNKTLEGMAEALWRKMFVDDADPKWQEYSLLEIIDLVGGGTPKTDVLEYWNGSVPWLSARDITSNHKSFIVQTEKYITEKGLKNSSTKILPKYATIISARGTVGSYCILSSPMAFSQSNYGILPKIDGCHFFTYLLIAHAVDELKAAAYGSVFDTITTNTFRDQKISLPTKDKIISFENDIKSYFNSILNNTIQIRTLSCMRDTLLPKLMSGEIKVKQ